VGGSTVEDDNDQCLYVGTPWEDDVIADLCDVDDFKEASCTIVRTVAVSTCTLKLQSFSLM
jgi:hypothetical protein